MRRSVSLAALLVIAGLVTACGGGGAATSAPAAPAGGAAVGIRDFAFNPAALTTKVGTEVTWANTDGAPHSVKWDDGTPTSPNLTAGGTPYKRTFAAAGTFTYVCGIHSNMKGSVVVS